MPKPVNSRTLCFEQLEGRELLDGVNYFVATNGNDSSDGLSPATAWRTVLRATRNTSLLPGDTINILPGVYSHDGIMALVNGAAGKPITVRADGGPVTIEGGALSNAWSLVGAANNVYVLNLDDTPIGTYGAFCGYTTTAYGYGAMTNIGNTFRGQLPDPGGTYNFDSDPTSLAQLFNPPPELVNKCFFYWTGSLVGNYISGTKMYLHAPPGWTQQDVSANVFIGDAGRDIDVDYDYWTFDHLTYADAYDGFNFSCNNMTVTNCTVRNIYNQPFFGNCNNLIFDHNLIESIGQEYMPVPTVSPAITLSKMSGLSEAVQFRHDADSNLSATIFEGGAAIGNYLISSSQTMGDLAQFFQGLGYTASVVGDPTRSSQLLLDATLVNVSQPQTFPAATWSLEWPLGSFFHGMYCGGDNALISNSIFENINGNGISYRYGNNVTISNNFIDNDLGGMLNIGGSNLTVDNNVFRSTVDAGNGINLAYGGGGGTIEFEQNTVAVANRVTLGFLDSSAGTLSTNWAIVNNIFENILPDGPTPFEMNIGATPSTTLANWKLRDNVYWVGDENGNPLPFQLILSQTINGQTQVMPFRNWSDYVSQTSFLWGWEQGSLNVDPQLDANYLPQNPAVIAMGVGAVLQNTATWTSTAGSVWSDPALWSENVVGPLLAPGLPTRLDNTDTATFNGGDSVATVDLSGMAPSLQALNFSDSDYTLQGGMLTLNSSNGPAIVTVGSGLQTIASPVTLATNADMVVSHSVDQLVIAGQVSGSGGLVKYGAGTLILSGNNTFTGGAEVDAGTLILTSAAALPVGASLTIGGGSPMLDAPDIIAAAAATPFIAPPNSTALSQQAQNQRVQSQQSRNRQAQVLAATAVDALLGASAIIAAPASVALQRMSGTNRTNGANRVAAINVQRQMLTVPFYASTGDHPSDPDRHAAFDVLMILDYQTTSE